MQLETLSLDVSPVFAPPAADPASGCRGRGPDGIPSIVGVTGLRPDVVGIPDTGPPAVENCTGRVFRIGIDDDRVVAMAERVWWHGGRWFRGVDEVVESEMAVGCREPPLPVDEAVQLGIDVLFLESGKEACCAPLLLVESYLGIIDGMASVAKGLHNGEGVGVSNQNVDDLGDIFLGSDHPAEFVVGEGYEKDDRGGRTGESRLGGRLGSGGGHFVVGV